MCMFTGDVEAVSDTQIFARLDGRGNQFLAYSMKVSTTTPVAMVLPIPVPLSLLNKEETIQFIDLQGYADLFDAMHQSFPLKQSMNLSKGARGYGDNQSRSRSVLAMHKIGQFVASCVPNAQSFDRLDPKFQLSAALLAGPLLNYQDHAFAVIQLGPEFVKEQWTGTIDLWGTPKSVQLHPIAMLFPTRYAEENRAYFPCKHLHHGMVQDEDEFDHALYFQKDRPATLQYDHAVDSAERHLVHAHKTRGVVDGTKALRRIVLKGIYKNEDIFV